MKVYIRRLLPLLEINFMTENIKKFKHKYKYPKNLWTCDVSQGVCENSFLKFIFKIVYIFFF